MGKRDNKDEEDEKKNKLKLKRGEGNLYWVDKEKTRMRLRRHYRCEANGKIYTLSVTSTSSDECFRLMTEKEGATEIAAKEKYKHSLDNPDVTLAGGIEDWLETFKYGNMKANAYDRLECTLENQIRAFPIGNTKIKDIDDRDIIMHLKSLYRDKVPNGKTEKGYSYSVIKKTYQLLDQFFNYYYARDINMNPMNTVRMPEKKEEISELSADDASRIGFDPDIVFDDIEMDKFKRMCLSPVKEGVSGSKFGKPIYFMLLTMIRAAEACGLLWGDIDLEKNTMKIVKQKQRVKNRDKYADTKTKLIITSPKSRSSIRLVPLTTEAVDVISAYKNECVFTGDSDPVFATSTGESITEAQLYKTLRGLLKSANIDKDKGNKKFNLHSLRHSGISYYIRHDVPISQVTAIAGHAQEMTTIGTYYHQVEAQKTEALNKMNAITRDEQKEKKVRKSAKGVRKTTKK